MSFKQEAAVSLDKWSGVELQDDGSLKVSNMIDGETVYETISQADLDLIDSTAATMQTDYDGLQWSRDRQAEYQKMTPYQQLEMISDGTYDAWEAAIKAEFPKP